MCVVLCVYVRVCVCVSGACFCMCLCSCVSLCVCNVFVESVCVFECLRVFCLCLFVVYVRSRE